MPAAGPTAGSEGSAEGEPAAAGEPAGEGQPLGDQAEAQQPAAGKPLPDKPAEQAQAVPAAALQPVVFPLAYYERLHGQLQHFGRQSGICLLSVSGMIPQPTLKSARWGLLAVRCVLRLGDRPCMRNSRCVCSHTYQTTCPILMRWPCRGMVRALPSPDQAAALYSKMPLFLERALLPFQREGVRFGLAHGGRCLIAGVLADGAGHRTEVCRLCVCTLLMACKLFHCTSPLGLSCSHVPDAADEMGVGKTVQAIALASCFEVRLLAACRPEGLVQPAFLQLAEGWHACWLNLCKESQCARTVPPRMNGHCW